MINYSSPDILSEELLDAGALAFAGDGLWTSRNDSFAQYKFRGVEGTAPYNYFI